MIPEKQKKLLIEQPRKTPIVQVACQKRGVHRATYYRWRLDSPEFAAEADAAIVEGELMINDLAESQLISAIQEKNIRAITFWLNHHHARYGTKVELAGGDFAYPSARALVQLAHAKALREDWIRPQEVELLYLRRPDAEINWSMREGA